MPDRLLKPFAFAPLGLDMAHPGTAYPPLQTQVEAAAARIRAEGGPGPRVGIVLGTGLADLQGDVDHDWSLPYADVPYFCHSTALGHRGLLVGARVGTVPILLFVGRCHLYEGYTAQQVTLPVRVLRALGAEALIVTNASGGLNPHFRVGDLVALADQINLMFRSPLSGAPIRDGGHSCAERSAVYDPALRSLARRIRRQQGQELRQGVYAGVIGPNYETRAEYRCLRFLGADLVGMSTVPEVLVAAQVGLRVLGLSVVTNVAQPDRLAMTAGEEVHDAAGHAAPRLSQLIREMLRRWDAD